METSTETAITTFNPQNEKPYYCSVKANTREDKVKLFNALENADLRLNDCVGQEIAIKDVYVERYTKLEGEEEKVKFRTILFGEDGKTYVTASYGVYSCISKIFRTFGTPDTWTEPLKVKVDKRNIGDGKSALNLVLVAE